MINAIKNKLGFSSKESVYKVNSPTVGKTISLSKVNDPTFAEEMIGKGVAVIPEKGEIYAPVTGKIESIFETKHAFAMITEFGVQVLVHVGINTVSLKGKFFEAHVSKEDSVKAGDLILTVDLEKVKELGYDMTTMIVICNTEEYKQVEGIYEKYTNLGDEVIKIIK